MSEPKTKWAVRAKLIAAPGSDYVGFFVRFAEENHARGFAATLSFSTDNYEIDIIGTTTERVGMRAK